MDSEGRKKHDFNLRSAGQLLKTASGFNMEAQATRSNSYCLLHFFIEIWLNGDLYNSQELLSLMERKESEDWDICCEFYLV